jgi:hypothetical protein
LLDAGANAYAHTSETRDDREWCPCALEIAIQYGRKGVVRILLQQADAVKKCEEIRYCPLVDAAEQPNTSLTVLLLEHGFDANATSRSRSVLKDAIECGNFDAVKVLLQHGANANDFEVEEIYDPIKMAVECFDNSKSRLGIIRLLLLHGAEVRKPVDEDWSKWISEGRTKESVHQDVYALYEICGDLNRCGGFNESNVDAYIEKWKRAIGYDSRRSKYVAW